MKRIIVNTKYGPCNVREQHYNNGHSPGIRSALNKTEYFINQLKEIFGNSFDYNEVKFVDSKTKVKLSDEFGTYNSLPSNLLKGKRPRVTSVENVNLFIINKLKTVHGDSIGYSLVDYKNTSSKIKLKCKKHNTYFEDFYGNLMAGRASCKKCTYESRSAAGAINCPGWRYNEWEDKGNSSKHFSGFKLYLIKCWKESESFYKIGKTFNKVNYRYKSGRIPYNWEKVLTLYSSAKEVCNLENTIKNKYKSYKCSIPFPGDSECLELDNNQLLNLINYIKYLEREDEI